MEVHVHLKKFRLAATLLTLGVAPLLADDGSINLVDTMWVLVAGFLVFFMNGRIFRGVFCPVI